MNTLGLHHYHKRTRRRGADSSAAKQTMWVKYADKMVYAAGIFTPLMTLPQLYNIWVAKNASGVSPVSWTFYLLGAISWTAYGLIHKAKPIIFTNGAMVIVNFFIVVGILLFG